MEVQTQTNGSTTSLGHPSPIVQSSKTKLFRTAGLESKSAQVKLHKEQVYLKKELERLERQAHTAINNVDNNKQSIKMIQRKIEKRAQESISSRSLTSLDRRHTVSSERPTLLQNRTVVTMPASSEMFKAKASHSFGTPTSAEPMVDGEDRPSEVDAGNLKNRSPYHSPYISSPALYIKRTSLPKAFKSPSKLATDDLKKSSHSVEPALNPGRPSTLPSPSSALTLPPPTSPTPSTDPPSGVPSQVEHDLKLPAVASSPQLQLKARPNTATKKKLKKVDLDGLGLEAGGQSQPDFRHFYKSKAPFLSAVFNPTTGEGDSDSSDGEGGKAKVDLEELAAQQTLEELYGEIKNCRYIRLYQPRYGQGQRTRQHQKMKSKKAWQSLQ
jgi:hypothetical protein